MKALLRLLPSHPAERACVLALAGITVLCVLAIAAGVTSCAWQPIVPAMARAVPAASAVVVADDGAPVARIAVLNPAPFPRRDVVTVTLSFSDEPDYAGEPLAVGDHPIDVRRLGPTWPDGSWRMATAHVPVQLAALERRSLEVRRARAAAAAPFRFGPGVLAAGLAGLQVGIRVDSATAWFGGWAEIESTDLVRAWRATARVPGSPVWGSVLLEAGAGLDHARLWLHVGDSDPRDQQVLHELGPVAMVVAGPQVALQHELAACFSVARAGTTTTMVLDPGSRWADARGATCRGATTSTLPWPARAPCAPWARYRGAGAPGAPRRSAST
jgi:hypothetical protein